MMGRNKSILLLTASNIKSPKIILVAPVSLQIVCGIVIISPSRYAKITSGLSKSKTPKLK